MIPEDFDPIDDEPIDEEIEELNRNGLEDSERQEEIMGFYSDFDEYSRSYG